MKKLFNFKLEPETIQKIKYIAWFERENITDVATQSVDTYIKAWEKKNGAITADKIKSAKL